MTLKIFGRMDSIVEKPTITIAPFVPSVVLPSSVSGAWQVGGWLDFEDAVLPVLAALGFDGVCGFGVVGGSGGVECFRVAPDRVWLFADDGVVLAPGLEVARGDSRLSVLDISHSRVVINVVGVGAESLMGRVAAVDFASLVDDGFVNTSVMGVSVLIRRRGLDSFDVFVPGSFGESVFGFLEGNV